MRSILAILSLCCTLMCTSQSFDGNSDLSYDSAISIQTETGVISPKGVLASITVPNGFTFINRDATCEILQYWGNSRESLNGVVGMLILDTTSSISYIDRGFIFSYNEVGHVVDDKMINYNFDKLLNNIQSSLMDNAAADWIWSPEYDVRKHYLSLPLLCLDFYN